MKAESTAASRRRMLAPGPDIAVTEALDVLALDQLRSAPAARERYTGEWLPEPIGTELSPLDPLDTVERRESVSSRRCG
jgi:hypothetical protein